MGFGSSGKGFHHSWWPHNGDRFNTDEFKGELQEVVDTFRADGPLKDLTSMRAFCYRNGGKITEDGRCYQEGIAYTLTATDHHAVFSRQRVDIFKDGEVTSTQSARQHKDATDLVLQGTDQPRLIRRLTPLECERLQGFPDGWTDIPNASDSSRYKALGNSVAIPCVDYVLQGIALVLRAG